MSTVTKPIALDETLQSTNTALSSLGKDTTLQAIATAIANVGLSNIGNMSSLATTDKTSLVSAINEVVGDVSNLDTDKADKVASATDGNLAGLNASGNLTDSGWDGSKTTTSASGNPISITGLKSNQLAVNPVITFEPIQAGSGDPSPSNVRAISGYDKIEVLTGGLNLVDQTKCTHTGIATDNGRYDTSYKRLWTELVRVKPNTTYRATIVGQSSASEPLIFNRVICYGKGKEFIRRIDGAQVQSGVYTVGADVYYINLDIRTSALSTDISISNITSLMLTEGQPSVSYKPYHKTTDLSEPLPQTVYGGSYDPRIGKLISYKPKKIKLSDLSWVYESVNVRFYSSVLSDAEVTDRQITTDKLICSHFQTNNDPMTVSGDGIMLHTNGRIYLRVTGVTDETTLVNTYGDAEIVYTVATPTEIQLTPHEISLLKDYAYVSTNGTNIALDYHNGEIATLGDVAQVGQTINKVEDDYKRIINNRCRISRSYQLSSSNPIVLSCNAYASCLLFGFLQGIGARFYAITVNAGAIAITNLMDGNSVPTSSTSMNFVYDSTSHTLTISSAYAQTSLVSIIGDGYIIK